MPALLLPDDLSARLDLLLRNRLPGLAWDYFAVDLDAAAADPRARASEVEVRAFFARLSAEADPPTVVPGDAAMAAAMARVADTHTATGAMAYFLALLRLDPEALADFIRAQLDSRAIANRSDADVGTLGALNAGERRRRNRAYRRKIADGHRDREGAVVVLAEGDSWFQFPHIAVVRPVKDLVFYLLRDPKYAVKTLAASDAMG